MGQNNNILPLVVHKLKEKQVRFGRSACVSDCVTSRARRSLSVSSLSSPHCTVGPSMFGMGVSVCSNDTGMDLLSNRAVLK